MTLVIFAFSISYPEAVPKQRPRKPATDDANRALVRGVFVRANSDSLCLAFNKRTVLTAPGRMRLSAKSDMHGRLLDLARNGFDTSGWGPMGLLLGLGSDGVLYIVLLDLWERLGYLRSGLGDN